MLTNFTAFINSLITLLSGGVATLLMTVAFIAFLWSVINYIWKRRNGDTNGLEQAKTILFSSVFGLFVMVSVWGLVNFLATGLLGADATKKTVTKPQTKF